MKKLFICIACFVFAHSAFSQFQHSYGTPQFEAGMSLTNLIDEDEAKYLLAGYTSEQFIGSYEATLTKTDAVGTQLWSAFYGGDLTDYFTSVRQSIFTDASQVSYVAAGGTYSFAFGGGDAWLVGTDINGAPLFSAVYGQEEFDVFYDVKNYKGASTDESGYIAVGATDSYSGLLPGRNVYVVKTDLFGNMVSATIIGYEGNQEGYWIEQTNDGGFILVGYSENTECYYDPTQKVARDILVVKLDSDLNIMWSRVLGYPGYVGPISVQNIARAVKESEEGIFYITGYTNAFGLDNTFDAFLLALDPDGGFIALNTYGNECDNEYGYSLEWGFSETGEEVLTIVGGDHALNSTDYNALMFQVNTSFSLLWAREYGSDGNEFGFELTFDDEQLFAFTGYTTSLGDGSYDKYLVETTLTGKSGTACETEIDLVQEKHDPCIVEFVRQTFVDEYEIITPKFDLFLFEEGLCDLTGEARLGQVNDLNSDPIEVQLVPNPTNDYVFIQKPAGAKVAFIKVFDLKGTEVKQQQYTSDVKQVSVDISNLKSGVYILEIKSDDGKTIRKKFVKE